MRSTPTATLRLLRLVLLAGLAACSTPTATAPAPTQDLGSTLGAQLATSGVPALGAAVVRGDRVIAIGAAGTRSADLALPVTLEDAWHLGSCTKSMTATWIATEVAAGNARWDATVPELFADFAAAEGFEIHPSWNESTLEQLLRNCGGAPSNLSEDGLWLRLRFSQDNAPDQRASLLRALLAKPTAGIPGEHFEYANAGFAIAAAAFEQADQATYEEQMRTELFAPLGMMSAGFGPVGRPSPTGEVTAPLGHLPRKDGSYRPIPVGPMADNPAAIAPAGRVHATLRDWAKYASLHLAAARGEPTALLSPADYIPLHTPALDGYAMGWVERPGRNGTGPSLWHNGSNTMWYCELAIIPSENLAVLVTCNAADDAAKSAVSSLVAELSAAYTDVQQEP